MTTKAIARSIAIAAGCLALSGVPAYSGQLIEIPIPEESAAATQKLARSAIAGQDRFKIPEITRVKIVATEFKHERLGGPLLVARIEDSLYCGSLGCLTFVFRQRRERWETVMLGNFGPLWVSFEDSQIELTSEDGHGMRKTVKFVR